MKKKKKIMIILIVISIVLLLEWIFIGYRFNFGPFKALGDIRMNQISGNAQSYNMDTVDQMEPARKL